MRAPPAETVYLNVELDGRGQRTPVFCMQKGSDRAHAPRRVRYASLDVALERAEAIWTYESDARRSGRGARFDGRGFARACRKLAAT